MLAAVDRMQRAELHSRLALVRLRNGLGDMAAAIGRAKAKAAGADEATRATDTAALLDEFEHLVDAMLEIAGGMIPRSRAQAAQPVQAASEAPVLETPAPPEPAATAPAAETDQVPTISGMAANLDRRTGGGTRNRKPARRPRWLPQRPARRWRCFEASSRR